MRFNTAKKKTHANIINGLKKIHHLVHIWFRKSLPEPYKFPKLQICGRNHISILQPLNDTSRTAIKSFSILCH